MTLHWPWGGSRGSPHRSHPWVDSHSPLSGLGCSVQSLLQRLLDPQAAVKEYHPSLRIEVEKQVRDEVVEYR